MALNKVLHSLGDTSVNLHNPKIISTQLGKTDKRIPVMDFDEEIVSFKYVNKTL